MYIIFVNYVRSSKYQKYYEFRKSILKVTIRSLWEVPGCTVVSVYINGQRCIPEGSGISTVRHQHWSREWANPRSLHGSKLLDLLCNIPQVLRPQIQGAYRGFVFPLTAIPRHALIACILPKQTSLRLWSVWLLTPCLDVWEELPNPSSGRLNLIYVNNSYISV